MLDGSEFHSDWNAASTDGCELERRHKQLLWRWRMKSVATG